MGFYLVADVWHSSKSKNIQVHLRDLNTGAENEIDQKQTRLNDRL